MRHISAGDEKPRGAPCCSMQSSPGVCSFRDGRAAPGTLEVTCGRMPACGRAPPQTEWSRHNSLYNECVDPRGVALTSGSLIPIVHAYRIERHRRGAELCARADIFPERGAPSRGIGLGIGVDPGGRQFGSLTCPGPSSAEVHPHSMRPQSRTSRWRFK